MGNIEGVVLDKVNKDVIVRALLECMECKEIPGVTPVAVKRLPLADLVRHLTRWYQVNVQDSNLVRCSVCKGISEVPSAAQSFCPYCGLADAPEDAESDDVEPEDAESDDVEPEDADADAESDDVEDDEGETEQPEPPAVVKSAPKPVESPKPSKPVKEPPKETPKPTKVKKPEPSTAPDASAPKKRGRPKGSKNKPQAAPTLTTPTERRGPGRPPKSESSPTLPALALVETVSTLDTGIISVGEHPTESLLDTISQKIRQMKSDAAVELWAIGRQIDIVFDSGLWKTRLNSGAPAYTCFNQWCDREIQMSHSRALELMDLSRKYDETTVRRLGTSKLQLIMRAPESVQPRLLSAAESGESYRSIREEITEAKKAIGMEKRDTGRRQTPLGRPGRAPRIETPDAGRTTVAVAVSDEEKVLNFVKCVDGVYSEAKSLEDEPIAFEDMENGGVVRVYQVKRRPAGLVLVITTKRT